MGGTGGGDSRVPGKASGWGGLQWGVTGLVALGDLGAEGYREAGSVESQGLESPVPMGNFGHPRDVPQVHGEPGTWWRWGRLTGCGGQGT